MAVSNAEEFIQKNSKWEEELRQLRSMLLKEGLEETIKWGAPTYSLGGKNVVRLSAFKNHYGLWFFQGALLKENTALLSQEDKTKTMRQMRFQKGDELDLGIISKYVREAMQNEREGKRIKPAPATKEIIIPVQLKEAMKNDKDLMHNFDLLSPGKKREYARHISEAKRESTKVSRLEKIIPMIKKGQGLYDKYKNC